MVRKARSPMLPVPIEPTTTHLTPKALTRQEFGRRLARAMADKEWNQSDLARAAGIGRDSVSTYINGKVFPTPIALRKIAGALGVDKEVLLPNELMSAFDDEMPAVELKQAAGHPEKAWLRVNRMMSFATAARIITLIDEEDTKA